MLLLAPSVAATTAIATAGVGVVVIQAKGLHDQVLEEGRENATSWDSGDGQVTTRKSPRMCALHVPDMVPSVTVTRKRLPSPHVLWMYLIDLIAPGREL